MTLGFFHLTWQSPVPSIFHQVTSFHSEWPSKTTVCVHRIFFICASVAGHLDWFGCRGAGHCGQLTLLLLGIVPEVVWLGCMDSLVSIFWGNSSLTSMVASLTSMVAALTVIPAVFLPLHSYLHLLFDFFSFLYWYWGLNAGPCTCQAGYFATWTIPSALLL
jgi:hypothetical protein